MDSLANCGAEPSAGSGKSSGKSFSIRWQAIAIRELDAFA